MKNLVVNNVLYDMQKDEAFSEIYNMVFPENTDIHNDYSFDISPESFADENCYVFIVCNGKQVRIMAAELNYNMKDSRHEIRDIMISETFITIDQLNEMISKLDICNL